MSDILAPDIIRFILTSVPSVPYLEALLLLRAEPDAWWSGEDLARRLYLSEAGANAVLGQLLHAGTAQRDNATLLFRYAPRTEELRVRLDAVADAYASHLIEVTRLIHSKADRMAHHFADAFRWRKED